jgi:hypothetical protein
MTRIAGIGATTALGLVLAVPAMAQNWSQGGMSGGANQFSGQNWDGGQSGYQQGGQYGGGGQNYSGQNY